MRSRIRAVWLGGVALAALALSSGGSRWMLTPVLSAVGAYTNGKKTKLTLAESQANDM